MMEFIQIATLIILFSASILLVVWLYRPGSDKKFDDFSKIPLNEDRKMEVKKRGRTAKKSRKK